MKCWIEQLDLEGLVGEKCNNPILSNMLYCTHVVEHPLELKDQYRINNHLYKVKLSDDQF